MPKADSHFRLSDDCIAALDAIAEHYGMSRTGAVEFAAREVARKLKVKSSSPAQARKTPRRPPAEF